MSTQTIQTTQTELTSVGGFEWNAKQRKVVALTFLVSAIGIALALGLGTLLGN